MPWYVTQQMTTARPDPLRQGTGSVWGWRRVNIPPQGRGGGCVTALRAPVAGSCKQLWHDSRLGNPAAAIGSIPARSGSARGHGASPDGGCTGVFLFPRRCYPQTLLPELPPCPGHGRQRCPCISARLRDAAGTRPSCPHRVALGDPSAAGNGGRCWSRLEWGGW